MMLDVSRHFFDKEEVKKIIDTMAVFKFNRFHWHLCDDQGWRVHIERYVRRSYCNWAWDASSPSHFLRVHFSSHTGLSPNLMCAGSFTIIARRKFIFFRAFDPTSPLTYFKSTLCTLRILKVRNSYLQNSQGRKLTLRMYSDLKKRSNFLFVTFTNQKI